MINSETAIAAIPLVNILTSKNLSLQTVSGTPLETLVRLTNEAIGVCVTAPLENLDLESNARSLKIFTQTGENGVMTPHDKTMDSYIESMSVAVRNHISFAKNEVKPAIMTMVDRVVKNIGMNKSATADFSVVVLDLPVPMRNSGFKDSIDKYIGKSVLEPEKELALGEVSLEDILTLMQTGSKEYDTLIAQWFSSKEAGFFTTLWDNLFRDFKVSKPVIVGKFKDFMSDTVDGADAALFVYLIARKLFDEVPGNTGMTLNEFNNIVSQYRDAAGAVLAQQYKRYNANITNSTLVDNFSVNRKTITVNGAIYREWLKLGGSNEQLFGLLISNSNIFSSILINENSKKYLSNWHEYEQYSNTLSSNQQFLRYKEILTFCFADGLKEQSKAEEDMVIATPGIKENIIKYFLKELESITTKDLQDINEVCLRLVCRARFFYTDAEKILRGINEAVRVNPNIDIRQAALLSTIEYVADFISDQFELKK